MVQEQSGVLSGHNPLTVNPTDPLTLCIIQIAIIVIFTRILHMGLKRIRQPKVISEVIGGIILGPSVLGHIPGYMTTIFPTSSLTYLNLLANLGLVLFLFIVGVELNPKILQKNIKAVVFISASGIALPFIIGIGVAYGLYDAMDNRNVPFTSFVLFICVAMAITAFPVLARILSELKLLSTSVGSGALTAAVGDDITAWILLAIVIAIINASSYLTALYAFLLCAALVLIVCFIVRPILLRLIVMTNSNNNQPSTLMVAITLSLVLISAFLTNIIGIHYIFGGFIIGAIIPHEEGFALALTEKIEDLITVLFIPIYFTLSGLNTNIGALDGTGWGWVILVILLAMIGKIVGCTAAAKLSGYTFREALTIGVFMSCKGLVELIILNIGYNAKIINDKVFAIMVLMALVTTFVTTPLATYLYPPKYHKKASKKDPEASDFSENFFRLLVVLKKVEHLPAMVTFVQLLQHTQTSEKSTLKDSENQSNSFVSKPISVRVLRLIELTQRMSAVMKFTEIKETVLHDPIMNMFSALSQISPTKVVAELAVAAPKDFCQEITEKVQASHANLVIIPWSGAGEIVDAPIENENNHAPHEKKHTSPHVAHFVQGVFNEITMYASVGVFVDRGLGSTDGTRTLPNPMGYLRVFAPFFGGADDREALTFVFKLLDYPNINISVLRIIKSEDPTDNDVTLTSNEIIEDEKVRPSFERKITTVSVNTDIVLKEFNEDETFLETYLKSKSGYPARNARINYQEIHSSTPIQTAVENAKKLVDRKDLVVVGRSRHSAINESHHYAEFMELIRNLGSYGNDTQKSLGYVSEAFLAGGVMASLLVLQAKQAKE